MIVSRGDVGQLAGSQCGGCGRPTGRRGEGRRVHVVTAAGRRGWRRRVVAEYLDGVLALWPDLAPEPRGAGRASGAGRPVRARGPIRALRPPRTGKEVDRSPYRRDCSGLRPGIDPVLRPVGELADAGAGRFVMPAGRRGHGPRCDVDLPAGGRRVGMEPGGPVDGDGIFALRSVHAVGPVGAVRPCRSGGALASGRSLLALLSRGAIVPAELGDREPVRNVCAHVGGRVDAGLGDPCSLAGRRRDRRVGPVVGR